MLDKSLIFQKCVDVLEERIKQIQGERAQVQASANDETKSSVGDKYETGRAMAQLEIERFTQQLIENEKLLNRLQELKEVQARDRIVPGSLVHTSQGYFYVSVSLGIIESDGYHFYCISPEAPLGSALLGKRVGDLVTINGRSFQIMTVC
jgi:transcription elongation GreA/GreB family factor